METLDHGLNRSSFLRHASRYLSATYLSRALCAVRGFINARWLGPELYGFWGGILLLLSFGYHLHGGVQEIMAREIPTYRSRGRVDLAHRTAQISFTFFFLLLLAASAVLWTVAARLPQGTPGMIRLGWVTAGVALPLEVLLFFEQTVTRAEERFERVSRGLLLAALISLALTGWLVTSYGLAGLYLVVVITPAVGLWYLRRRAEYRWRFVWSWDTVFPMLKAGWPILAMTLVFEALWWVDRLLVWGWMGTAGFGFYGLGVMLVQLCFLFPEVVASIIQPQLYFDYARGQRLSDVMDHLWFPLKTLALVFPLGLAMVDLLLPLLIHRWLPAYAPGMGAMRVLIWGSFFMGLAICTKPAIVALGQQKRVLWFYGAAIAVNVVLGVALILVGWGLTGIAVGTAVAYCVCCTGLLVFTFRRLGEPLPSAIVRTVALYGPWVLTSAAMVGFPFLAARLNPSLGELVLPVTRWTVALSYGISVCLWMRRVGEIIP